MTFQRRHLHSIQILTFALLASSLPYPAFSDDTPITLDTIINAWKAREEKIQTFDLHWWSRHFESASYFAIHNQPRDQRKEDTTFICRYRLAGDAKGRTRFEQQGRQWDTKNGRFADQTTIEVFDGQKSTTLASGGIRGYPYAMVFDKFPQYVVRDHCALPVIVSFRAVKIPNAGFGNCKNLEFDKQSRLTARGKGVDTFVDFEPSMDFLPVRVSETWNGFNDNRAELTEIHYVSNEASGWVPQTWTYTCKDSAGNLLSSDEAKLLKQSINEAVDESEFTLDLPVGTLVQPSVFRSDEDMYLVRAGGRRQIIHRGEFNGENYQQLLESELKEK